MSAFWVLSKSCSRVSCPHNVLTAEIMTRGHLECLGFCTSLRSVRLSLSHGVSRRYSETWRDVSIENGTRSYKTDNGCHWLGAYQGPGMWHLLIKASVLAGPTVELCDSAHYLTSSQSLLSHLIKTALCAGSL